MTGWISGRRKSAEIADVEQGKYRVYKLAVRSPNAATKLDSGFRRNDFNLMTPRKLSRRVGPATVIPRLDRGIQPKKCPAPNLRG